ncbi:lysoplasmalogenase [Pseudoruegeria sp. SHC-113]|uniref:lysoplasmalogenase n=1 Tax=Pseudoruegeria sp. SHC-113 TaxID=2855439 RepID=UPI0021BA4507|nr:lysoplasmalogenase [Pseudoruegeria sp. SHC-113]MCT8159842.1 lysoplasmalogenase [Pseudoruegeria sp. SHC-113]
MPLFALLGGIALAGLYLPWLDRAPSVMRSLLKTLPVAVFALGSLIAGAPLLAAALAASALGDLALSRDGERAFLAGMGAFALGHLLYIANILQLSGNANPFFFEWAAIPFLLLAASTEIWLRPHTGALLWPVRLYVVIITAMGVLALSEPDAPLIALGAASFVLSDLLLAIFIFRLAEDHPARKSVSLAVWITYITAQALLAEGLLTQVSPG